VQVDKRRSEAHAGVVNKAVGEAIREARTAKGLRAEDVRALLAAADDPDARVVVTQPAYSRWETGDNPVSLNNLVAIERVLGVPAGYLFVRAGLVPSDTEVVSAVGNDPLLDEAGRLIVLNAYEAEVERVKRQRRSRVRSARRRS
jgi:transcriptional regulator with XRE-family HTH domain